MVVISLLKQHVMVVCIVLFSLNFTENGRCCAEQIKTSHRQYLKSIHLLYLLVPSLFISSHLVKKSNVGSLSKVHILIYFLFIYCTMENRHDQFENSVRLPLGGKM